MIAGSGSSEIAEPSSRGNGLAWLTAGLLALVTLACLRGVLGIGLVGHDTYPLIEGVANRSIGELWTAKFLDGQLGMVLHRPVQNSLLALEYSLFGLEPQGYQWLHLLDWTAMVLALFALAWRLLGRVSPDAPAAVRCALAALPPLGLALHPLIEEIAPVVSRNHDPQALALTFAGLWLVAGRRFGPIHAVFLAVLCLLAAGIKETGYFAGPFCALLRLFTAPKSSFMGRFGSVLRDTGPAALAVAALLFLRVQVLGGAGEGAKGEFYVPGMLAAWGKTLLPQPGLLEDSAHRALAIAQLAGLLALLFTALRGANGEARRIVLGTTMLGLAWVLLGGVLSGLAGEARSWRLLFPYAGFAVISVAAFSALIGRHRSLAASIGAALLLLGLGARASYSPLIATYDQWQSGTERLHEFQDEVLSGLDTAQIGDVVFVVGPPSFARPTDESAPHVQAPAVMGTHSLRSFLSLSRPSLPVRVTGVHGRSGQPTEVVQLALSSEFDSYVGPGRRFSDAIALMIGEFPKVKPALRDLREARHDNDGRAASDALLEAVNQAGPASAPMARTLHEYFEYIEDPVAIAAIEAQFARWGLPIEGPKEPAP